MTMILRKRTCSLHALLAVLLTSLCLTLFNLYELLYLQKSQADLKNSAQELFSCSKPVVWMHGKKLETGYLDHVIKMFQRAGYDAVNKTYKWNVLWSHDYPFTELAAYFTHLLPHQKVNHFPGSGYVTQKVSLATSNLKHIPPAFKIPAEKAKLLKYANENPEKMWVQKSNSHRGIYVQKVQNLDFKADGTFVQEYIGNPFLIDGRKFDIGVYTILASIDPLRVYIYNGDALLRFCPDKYEPFDSNNLLSYVVADDYLPTWKVPSLQYYYVELGLTMKETLNTYIRSQGKNPQQIWSQIDEAISSTYYEKEPLLIKSALKYKSTKNFFELVRFDFVLDEDFNVYLMEANMSPNLSSAHFPPNQLIYEQVLFNLLSLVGLAKSIHSCSSSRYNEEIEVSDRDIQVYLDECASDSCKESCQQYKCQLCKWCLTEEDTYNLKSAYLEHVNRQNCRRVIPQSFIQEEVNNFSLINFTNLSEKNSLMLWWFYGKCLQDTTWCI